MKRLVLAIFILSTQLFALTPFSLENLKALNVSVLHKGTLVNETKQATIKHDIEQRLHTLGIQTQTQTFANLLIKIQTVSVGKETVAHISFLIAEEAILSRSIPTEGMAIGFQIDDLVHIQDPLIDLEDTINYLFDEFLEQYKLENPR